MVEKLAELGRLAVVTGLTLGPIASVMWLLNVRDRRQSMLLAIVLRRVASPHLRGRVSVGVRCALLSRRSVVTVRIGDCSRDEFWEAVSRLRGTLPSPVRLAIEGVVDQGFPATVTIEATKRRRFGRLAHPSVAAG